MKYIEPHIHMVSRTVDDYKKLAQSGYVAVSEPAFWASYDRTPQGFYDYFHQLTTVEPARAAQFGIKHYTWICINPKEAEDVVKAREVIDFIPEFLEKPNVIGVGEIGLNKNTKNEASIFEAQVELALKHNKIILVHTPHLEDKLKGTLWICDMLKNQNVNPDRVLIDHVEEHTIHVAKKHGFWCGMTLYPTSKLTPERASDIVEVWGSDRIWVNGAADWGVSDPLAVKKMSLELIARGHPESLSTKLFYNNPSRFMGQSGTWGINPGEDDTSLPGPVMKFIPACNNACCIH